MARLKMKKLEEYLQCVDHFEQPKILLEQYPTPPHIAACMTHHMQAQHDDIDGKFVADLGCGCGMLSIGAALLGAQLTVGFELDDAALNIYRQNVIDMELPGVDGVRVNVLHLAGSKWDNVFDTVLMNPPFGTKHNAGMDMRFLDVGMRLATGAVYSLHKTSTRTYIQKKSKEWGARGNVVAELRYNIDASYKFHKQKSKDIEVDFWRFDVSDL
ncbi:rRNA N6-adenosine-methyltransferase METTL5 [Drosophila grimshawi]|uniref:Methyltransferase-like protein 5 n=1 Tax=Drosophila grimshawi TaxID=7222 RepID=B4J185_DROGR|nr:rRNA N6-adenosine-methyltransferase METTL5 [Drosophila grimshawi]EDV97954.1 GH17170 [Drosophila grimshawi]